MVTTFLHCTKNNLNLRIKTEPVIDEAEAMVYVRLLVVYFWKSNQTYIVVSAPTVTSSVFIQIFRILGQCGNPELPVTLTDCHAIGTMSITCRFKFGLYRIIGETN